MKRILILLMTIIASKFAQSQAEGSPDLILTPSTEELTETERMLWDIHFDYNLTNATLGDVGMAGVVFFGNEFWVSKWASDSIVKLNNSGVVVSEFIIPGLTGVRALSTNDSYIFAANNTNTIYRINPITMTLAPPHIITPIASTRYCAYDPTLDGGLGGFWLGNFSTDLTAINMSGVALTTIPSATHGLSGMYGTSVDNTTAGGPFLWVFHQEGANNCQLSQLQLPSGIPTGLTHDVFPDFSASNSLTSGLAGGIHISTLAVPGNVTLMGVMQGTPNNVLFGYDLEAPGTDVEISSLRTNDGYTMIPIQQVANDSVSINITNNSPWPIDSVTVIFEVEHNSIPIYSSQQIITNITGTQIISFSQPYLSTTGIGTLKLKATAVTGLAQPDTQPTNDSLSFYYSITDSLYSRDNGIPDGSSGYSIGGIEWAYITTNFEFFESDTIHGVWVQLESPVNGDTLFGVLFNTSLLGDPTALIASSSLHIINSSQSIYFLEFANPIMLTSGIYAVGVYEPTNANLGVAQSMNIYTENVSHYYTPNIGWNVSSYPTARFIRPILGVHGSAGNVEVEPNHVNAYPNPTHHWSCIQLPNLANWEFSIVDNLGRCVLTGNSINDQLVIDVSMLPVGIYSILIESEESYFSTKLIKQ